MSLFGELKRRNVFRVGIAYLIIAWLTLQVVDIVGPILELPTVFGKGVLLLLAIGLPIAVILSWAYELTPEGVKKEKDVDRSASTTHHTGRKLDFIIIGVLSVAVVIFALDKFVWSGGDSSIAPVFVAETAELGKSIAVLPFVNRSADESDAYFVDGIHDDILTQLHKVSGIDKVISRTSMERYRDTEMSIPEIAAELGVSTVLEGSVQRAGDRVRITVQLIGAVNDEHLWAENFDRDLTTENVFEIQSEISIAIAESLQATLTDDESSELSGIPTLSLAAYDAYLLGRYSMRDREPSEIERAKAYFEEAIDLDPEFALAYVGLADAFLLTNIYRATTDEEGIANLVESESAARRALEINGRLGEAYASLGYGQWQRAVFWGFGEESLLLADTYYQQALELSPNYADLYRWYAQTLWLLSKPEDALAMAARAVALDPLLAVNHVMLGDAYDVNGRTEEALASYAKSVEISPEFGLANAEKITMLFKHSRYAEAILAGRAHLEDRPTSTRVMAHIAWSYQRLGDDEQFKYWATRIRELGPTRSNAAVLIDATVLLESGNTGAAIEKFRELADKTVWCTVCAGQVVRGYAKLAQSETLLAMIEEYNGELLDRQNPVVTPRSALQVAPVVWALIEIGEREQAEQLAETGLEVARNNFRQGTYGYGVEISDAEIQAVLGNHQFALDALVEAVNSGYRNLRWIEESPFLDPIRSDPKFVAAMDIIRADRAAQLERVREMERNGELPALPQ